MVKNIILIYCKASDDVFKLESKIHMSLRLFRLTCKFLYLLEIPSPPQSRSESFTIDLRGKLS